MVNDVSSSKINNKILAKYLERVVPKQVDSRVVLLLLSRADIGLNHGVLYDSKIMTKCLEIEIVFIIMALNHKRHFKKKCKILFPEITKFL